MNIKRTIGILILIVGIILIIFAIYQKGRIQQARNNVSEGKGLLPKSAVTEMAGDIAEGKIAQYDTPVLICLIGGIVIAIVGLGMSLCRCKK